MKRWPLIVAASLVPAMLCSCNRSEEPEDTSAKRLPAPSRSEASETPGTSSERPETTETSSEPITLERRNEEPARGSRLASRFRPLPVTRSDRLLSTSAVIPSSPMDFEIGPLYGGLGSADARALVETADRFFGELEQGSLSEKTVAAASMIHLTRSLRPFLSRQDLLSAVRLSMPEIVTGGRGYLEFRAWGGRGETTGTLVFVLAENRWYVADIQGDLRSLDERAPERTEPFDPAAAHVGG